MYNNNSDETVDNEQANTFTAEEFEALRAKANEAEETTKKYKELQAEFTRRNQSKSRGQDEPNDDADDGIKNANEYLKNYGSKVLKEELGFASKEDLATLVQNQLKEERDLEKLEKFPQLASQKDAILQLSRLNGTSIEETIKKYNFIDTESMENFHKPTIGSKKKTVGSIDLNNPTQEDLELIKNMSSEEFEKFTARQSMIK